MIPLKSISHIKAVKKNSVIVALFAFDKNRRMIFSHKDSDGISGSTEAIRILKATKRKNTSFKPKYGKTINDYYRK